MTRRLLGLALLLGLTACDTNFADPTRYGRYRDDAPVVALTSPGSGPLGGRYGDVLVGLSTYVNDGSTFFPASRLGVAGGESSMFFVYAGFGDNLVPPARTMTAGPHPAFPTRLLDGCDDLDFCGEGSSRSIAAMPTWGYEGRVVHGCVAVPAGSVLRRPMPATEMLQIRCESEPTTVGFVEVPDGIEFGASAVGIPETLVDPCEEPVPHPVGAALFGAPSDLAGAGAIHVLLAPPFAYEVAIDLGITTPAGSGLGHSIAASPQADGTVLVATSTRSSTGEDRQVVLFSLAAGTPGEAPIATVHACLTGDGPGFGHALAFGDLDDDDRDELIVGGVEVGRSTGGEIDAPISIWQTRSLLDGSAAGCTAGGAPAPAAHRELACPVGHPGISCPSSGFGTSVAVGDIDGDSVDDLVVGAPLSNASTGAVLVFPGGSTIDVFGTDVGHVESSTVRSGASLGFAVATIRGTDRDEIAASLPGISEVDVFFCTALDGDRASSAPFEAFHVCARRVAGVAAPICGGTTDAGIRDAGVASDAGDVDAGDPADAGDVDAGDPADAGDVDAGDPVDAGDVDAG